MDIWERIRYARDRAREAENTEKQRLADADTVELQRAASVRLATRQAVREGFDDILGDEGGESGTGSDDTGRATGADSTSTESPEATDTDAGDTGASGTDAGDPGASNPEASAGEAEESTETASTGGDDSTPLTGTATSVENAEPSYAGAGTPTEGDVQEDPGSQSAG